MEPRSSLSKEPLRLELTDFGLVHSSATLNRWLLPGLDYRLEVGHAGRLVELRLSHSPAFTGGRGWLSSPTLPVLLRDLGVPLTTPLSRRNRLVLDVRVLNQGELQEEFMDEEVYEEIDHPFGTWYVRTESYSRELTLDGDDSGTLRGSVAGDQIVGYWAPAATMRVQFVVLSEVDVAYQQVFVGYLGHQGHVLAGTHSIFCRSGEGRSRMEFGWYATRL